MKKNIFWGGFTLIELSAVATIVSALSVGTYMGVQKGRERDCINNLKQIHTAVIMFEMDNGYLPDASFFPTSSADPKGLNNILENYGLTENTFLCPSIPEQLNRNGINYLWNDTVNNKFSDSLPPNTWIMTEMTAVSKNTPGPHTGRFSILYAGGNAQIGERIYFPETTPTQQPAEVKKIERELTVSTYKEARIGEKIKIFVNISEKAGKALTIQPGKFSITTDDPSADIQHIFELNSETSTFDFTAIFNKAGDVLIKIKEESSGLEGESRITILPELTSQFLLPQFPRTWRAGEHKVIHIYGCDTNGNRTDGYNGEAILLTRKGKVSPEKITIVQGVWIGAIALTEPFIDNILYVSGERGILGTSSEFTINNAAPSFIEIIPASKMEAIAGTSYDLIVEVKDVYGNRCIDYAGEIEIELPDGATADMTKITMGIENKGWGQLSVVFLKTGRHKIKAFSKEIKGEREFYVNPGLLHNFSIETIRTQEAGNVFNITIKATDKWGNTVKGYYLTEPSGEVEYIKRDASSSIWMETVLINKAGQYNIVVENLLGNQGYSNTFTVKPSYPETIEIEGIPLELISGTEYSGTITIKDKFNNIINDYKGDFILETKGITAEMNGLNIKILPKNKGYGQLSLKDNNSNLFTEKHLVVISDTR